MTKLLRNSDGQPISMPEGIEDAKRYNRPHYDCGEECDICVSRGFTGLLSRKRYTYNGKCVHCARIDAIELHAYVRYEAYIDLLPSGDLEYGISRTGVKRVITREYCDYLDSVGILFGHKPCPTSIQEAIKDGHELYIRDEPCAKEGHLGVTTLKGDCYYCNQIADAEKEVRIAKGELKLQAAKERLEERVAKRELKLQKEDGRLTADSIMMKACPDLIISRVDARGLGVGVYRTGEECRRGHKGFRYVSSGNCIFCLRGHL